MERIVELSPQQQSKETVDLVHKDGIARHCLVFSADRKVNKR